MNTSFERGNDRTDEWYTPKWIIDALGPFDLDPCAPSEQFYTAKKCYTKEIDGLYQEWEGRVWLNPPYKNPLIGKFMKRLAKHGNGIALVFNRMDTALWHDVIFPNATAIRILRGRLKFVGQTAKNLRVEQDAEVYWWRSASIMQICWRIAILMVNLYDYEQKVKRQKRHVCHH